MHISQLEGVWGESQRTVTRFNIITFHFILLYIKHSKLNTYIHIYMYFLHLAGSHIVALNVLRDNKCDLIFFHQPPELFDLTWG